MWKEIRGKCHLITSSFATLGSYGVFTTTHRRLHFVSLRNVEKGLRNLTSETLFGRRHETPVSPSVPLEGSESDTVLDERSGHSLDGTEWTTHNFLCVVISQPSLFYLLLKIPRP